MKVDKLLSQIRNTKEACSSDGFDYEDGYGEMCHLVFTALDIADELREAVCSAKIRGQRLVLGKDVPKYYTVTILEQMDRIRQCLDPEGEGRAKC